MSRHSALTAVRKISVSVKIRCEALSRGFGGLAFSQKEFFSLEKPCSKSLSERKTVWMKTIKQDTPVTNGNHHQSALEDTAAGKGNESGSGGGLASRHQGLDV